MKKMNLVGLLTVFALSIVASTPQAFAQQTGRWELTDSVPMKYIAWRSNISAANSSDLALIAETNSFPLLHVVRHSTDGGATWNTLFFDTSKGTARWNTIVHNRPEQYAIAGDSEAYLGMSGYNVLYRYRGFLDISVDGGATWIHRDFDSNSVVSDLAMLTDEYGVALTHNAPNIYNSLPGTLPDSLFITTDGWGTFKAVAMPDGVQGCPQIFCFGVDTFGVIGWPASDGLSQYYRTTNGGQSWELLGKFQYVNQMQFLNARHAWGAGTDFSTAPYRGFLVETTDGGVSWQRRMDTDLSIGFGSISFADSLHGLVAGEYILRTTDGGASWAEEYPPFGVVTPSNYVSQILETAPDSAVGVFRADPVIRFTGKYSLSAPFFHTLANTGPLPIAPVTISWTPVAGAEKYHIQLATVPINVWKDTRHFFDRPALDTILTDTELTISTPEAASFYYGRASAIRGIDTSDWRQSGAWFQINSIFYTVSQAGIPLPPSIVFPPSGSLVGVTVPIRFSSITGANSYELKVWLQGVALLIDTTVNDTDVVVTNLPAGNYYYAVVRANIPNDTTDWSNGNYYFYIDASGVTSTSSPDAGFVYPNPAADFLHITKPGDRIQLYNELGAKIAVPKEPDASGFVLDVHSLPNGAYLLRTKGRFFRILVAH